MGNLQHGSAPMEIATGFVPGLSRSAPLIISADSGDGVTHIHFVRALYIAMLGSVPVQQIVGFWQSHPLHHHGEWLSGSDLFKWIWEYRGTACLNWVTRVMQGAERFFVSQGFDFQILASRMNSRVDGTSCISGSTILSSMRPLAHILFQNADLYRLAFELLPVISEAHFPGAIHQCLPIKQKPEGCGMAVLFVLDKTYSGRWPCDYHFFGGAALKIAPCIFGIPPFDEVAPLSDCRTISDVLWEGDIVRKEGKVFLDGDLVGESVRFFEYIATIGLDLSGHGIPDRDVILIHRGVKCERRNRTVLHSGCVYEAPVYLSLLRHPGACGTRASLGPIIADMHSATPLGQSNVNNLHQALLVYAGAIPTFTYHLVSQALTYNGVTIIKGLPACIFRRAILQLLTLDRFVFSSLDFKKAEDPGSYPLHDNFETNLSRLMERLETRKTCIQIARVGRGKFRLVPSGAYDYKETNR